MKKSVFPTSYFCYDLLNELYPDSYILTVKLAVLAFVLFVLFVVQTRAHLTFSITLSRNTASCQDFVKIFFRSSVCRYTKLHQRIKLAQNIFGYFHKQSFKNKCFYYITTCFKLAITYRDCFVTEKRYISRK